MIGKLSPAQLADFTEFAQGRQRHLMRTAYLLCGDRQQAQDLTQTALLNLCRHWGKVHRADSVDSYAHRVLINGYLSQRRKHEKERKAQQDSFLGPQSHDPSDRTELRLSLLAALNQLAPRGRAIVVLRYWEDLSVAETAAALSCSEGNVKSQSSRALARLRELMGDSVFDAHQASEAHPVGHRIGRHQL